MIRPTGAGGLVGQTGEDNPLAVPNAAPAPRLATRGMTPRGHSVVGEQFAKQQPAAVHIMPLLYAGVLRRGVHVA